MGTRGQRSSAACSRREISRSDAGGRKREREQRPLDHGGSGGFNVNVGGNTNLVGAVISSTANASLNSLSTGTLTYSNIQNQASYNAKDSSFSANYSAAPKSAPVAPSGFGSQATSGSASGVTQSAIAAGTIDVRSGGSLDGLSRDTTGANQVVDQIFNQEKVQETLQLGQLTGQLGMTLVGQIADKMEQQAYQKHDKEQMAVWSEGGADRTALHGIIGAIGASLTGGSALAGASGAVAGELADAAVQTMVFAADKHMPAGEKQLLSSLAFSVVAGVAGGIAGGADGASYAQAGDLYNRQLNRSEVEALKKLEAENPGDVTRLQAAACFLTECWRQLPDSDPDKAKYEQMAQTVSDDYNSYLPEIEALKSSTDDNGNAVPFAYDQNGQNSGMLDDFARRDPSGAGRAIAAEHGFNPANADATGVDNCPVGGGQGACVDSLSTGNTAAEGLVAKGLTQQQFDVLALLAQQGGTPAWDQGPVDPTELQYQMGEGTQLSALDKLLNNGCNATNCLDNLTEDYQRQAIAPLVGDGAPGINPAAVHDLSLLLNGTAGDGTNGNTNWNTIANFGNLANDIITNLALGVVLDPAVAAAKGLFSGAKTIAGLGDAGDGLPFLNGSTSAKGSLLDEGGTFTIDDVTSPVGRNDGSLGESIGVNVVQEETGIPMQALQNASGNGADAIGIDEANKQIIVNEVKSSTVGNFPDPNNLDLYTRSDQWIRQAASGTLNNQAMSPQDIQFATKARDLLDQGYQLKVVVTEVSLPPLGQTGSAAVKVVPVLPPTGP